MHKPHPSQPVSPSFPCSPSASGPCEAADPQAAVRERYGRIAEAGASATAWGGAATTSGEALARSVGYSAEQLAATPAGARLGLGSGNPLQRARLRPGEAVVDLGSGAGIDCFLAAEQVGPSGRVVGVDMTPQMVDKARELAAERKLRQVQFVLGAIEALPLGDARFDVALSNCVFNLSADRPRAFAEAHRVLKPGGRLVMSDLIALKPLPEAMRSSVAHHVGCMAGAASIEQLTGWLHAAGFVDVRIEPRPESAAFIRRLAPDSGLAEHLSAADIEAVRPPRR